MCQTQFEPMTLWVNLLTEIEGRELNGLETPEESTFSIEPNRLGELTSETMIQVVFIRPTLRFVNIVISKFKDLTRDILVRIGALSFLKTNSKSCKSIN